ncbi:MAG: EamA family transporter [Candidatus Eremiobacteraeota bacterium]|nr:EamA family transporter [Candidatus Eremiobacteraeota bacterium]
MLAIALALACALTYGAADFLGGISSRRASLYGVMVISQLCGLAVICAALPFLGGRPDAHALVAGAVAGLFGAGGIALLYIGLAIGRMGIVSPITAGLAAAFPALWGIGHGEHPSSATFAGLACALIAIVLVSLTPDEPGMIKVDRRFGLPAGVAEAIASGLFLSGFFIILGTIDRAAGLTPLVTARVASIAALAAIALVAGRPLSVPRSSLAIVLVCGALDMIANVFFVLATRSGLLSIVVVISSLYPAATVALAAILLRERLIPVQWAGVGFALVGIALIAA